jgi:hypothetical protein
MRMVLDVIFAQRVARFIDYRSVTKTYNMKRMEIFTDKVGVSIATAQKWATGLASPSPMKKKEAEMFLDSWNGKL